MAKRGGFPGGMPGNMNNLMKQAQKMQKQMAETTKALGRNPTRQAQAAVLFLLLFPVKKKLLLSKSLKK